MLRPNNRPLTVKHYAGLFTIVVALTANLTHLMAQTNFHDDNTRTVLVTGAASGIGRSVATTFRGTGYTVYATDIDTSRWEALEAIGCKTLYLDVTDEGTIQEAFATIEGNGDRIDILVNNAGYGQNGFLEELPLDDLRRQFEVNVFSMVRLAQMVASGMRERGNGLIINIGSVGGDFTSPGAGAYHASKYAVESISDALRQELGLFDIDVVLIKPGGVNTDFTENALPHYPEPMQDSPYLEQRERFLSMTATVLDPEKSSYPILDPQDVADKVFKAATRRKPSTRYRVGTTAKLMPLIKSLRGDRGLDRMFWKAINKE